jgi:TM2 domain-containing membrane protein YozV
MKTRIVAILLALFLGGVGIHKLYLGKILTGVLYLLFCWTFIPAILALVDIVILLTMTDDKFNEKYNK